MLLVKALRLLQGTAFLVIQISLLSSELELQSVAFALQLFLLTEEARFTCLHLLQSALVQVNLSLLHRRLSVELADLVMQRKHLVTAAVKLLLAHIKLVLERGNFLV